MKLRLGAATFVATTLLMGGGVAYSLVAEEPTDDVVVTEPTTDEPTTDVPEVEEPEGDDVEGDDVEGDDVEGEEPEADDVEGDEKPGGEEAAAEHREAMAAWKDCVDAAVEAASATQESTTEEPATEPVDVLTLCGTKPAPPGKALGWDGEKVSKSAQKKVDRAAAKASGEHGKPDQEPKAEKAPKSKKGKGHQR